MAILFKEAGTATRVSVRTKPGGVDATVLTGTFGGGGHARAAGATVALRSTTRPAARCSRRRAARGRGPAVTWRARRSGPGLDGVLVVAKPSGPTSHDVVGARPAARGDQAGRPRRDAGPVRRRRAAGVPGSRDAARRVPPRRPQGATARRSASARRPRPTTSRASGRRSTGRPRRARRSRRRSPG